MTDYTTRGNAQGTSSRGDAMEVDQVYSKGTKRNKGHGTGSKNKGSKG